MHTFESPQVLRQSSNPLLHVGSLHPLRVFGHPVRFEHLQVLESNVAFRQRCDELGYHGIEQARRYMQVVCNFYLYNRCIRPNSTI